MKVRVRLGSSIQRSIRSVGFARSGLEQHLVYGRYRLFRGPAAGPMSTWVNHAWLSTKSVLVIAGWMRWICLCVCEREGEQSISGKGRDQDGEKTCRVRISSSAIVGLASRSFVRRLLKRRIHAGGPWSSTRIGIGVWREGRENVGSGLVLE